MSTLLLSTGGLLSLLVGLALIRSPEIIDWLNAQTNLWGMKMWERLGSDYGAQHYEESTGLLRKALPAFFILVGIVLLLAAVSSLASSAG